VITESQTTVQNLAGRNWHFRLAVLGALFSVVPSGALSRTLLLSLKACGIRIGRATLFVGMPMLTGRGPIGSRLRIGECGGINEHCEFNLGAPISIGDNVMIGHGVRFLTTQRANGIPGAAPITVGNGVWIGAHCTFLGGVNVGAGAVIGAGCLVSTDVPPDTLVAGTKRIALARGEFLPPASKSLRERLHNAWLLEFSQLRWRLLLCTLLAKFLPDGRFMRLRTLLIRCAGCRVGSGTRFRAMPKLQSMSSGSHSGSLRMGRGCSIGTDVLLEFAESVTVGDRVAVADRVAILTTTHDVGPSERRAGAVVTSPVTIGNDVQIGAGVIILPGLSIGDAARVLPDSVVNSSVAPGVTVGGVPARPVPARATGAG